MSNPEPPNLSTLKDLLLLEALALAYPLGLRLMLDDCLETR